MARHHDQSGQIMEQGKTDHQMMTGIDDEFGDQLTDPYHKTLSLKEAFVQSDNKMKEVLE
jgi:hypothetical protein